jgi:hypothetical protein
VEYFSTTREAKEFLIDRIVEQAQRDSIDLSEIERKMLYFSEVDETLPDMMEISAAFDLEYDQAAYEEKMASIIRNFATWAKLHDIAALAQWKAAIKKLKSEDQYILVLTGIATGLISYLNQPSGPSILKMVVIIVGVGIGLIFLRVLWIAFQ